MFDFTLESLKKKKKKEERRKIEIVGRGMTKHFPIKNIN